MAFADEVTKAGRGGAWRMDWSSDNWSTISYRLATMSGVDSNVYEARIVGLSNITKALPESPGLSVGSFECTLDNTDGAYDWMLTQATFATTLKLRCRLYVGLFNALASTRPPTVTWQQVGEYVITDMPTRDASTVTVGWGDDASGMLLNTIQSPTVHDWYNLDSGCPLRDLPIDWKYKLTFGLVPSCERQLPLLWGEEVFALVLGLPLTVTDDMSASYGKITIPICATKGNPTGGQDAVIQFHTALNAGKVGSTLYGFRTIGDGEISQPARSWPSLADGTVNDMWDVITSSSFTFNGESWRVVYLQVDALTWVSWFSDTYDSHRWSPISADDYITQYWGYFAVWVKSAWVRTSASSAITNINVEAQHCVDIVTDLATYYVAQGGSGRVDATRNARVKAATPNNTLFLELNSADGDITAPVPTLTELISELCDSADLSCFIGWDGKVALSGRNQDFDLYATTLPSIPEERMANQQDMGTQRTQRGAYCNRVNYSSVTEKTSGPDGRLYDFASLAPIGPLLKGPWDNPNALVPLTARVYERDIGALWVPRYKLQTSPWLWRAIDNVPRQRFEFDTGLEGLTHELGDFISLSWTRNGTAVYSSVPFQIIGIDVNPSTCVVHYTCLWYGDLALYPYLLDDETLLVRASGWDSIAVVDTSDVVTLSGTFFGSFTSKGVAAGDILQLVDTGLPDDNFHRNRCLRISQVISTTQIRVADSDLDFFGGAAMPAGQWNILRGSTTYPTGGSWPSGNLMYGRVADVSTAAGVFSDSSAANLVINEG